MDNYNTEYDDVLYIVGATESKETVNWKVIKASDEEIQDNGSIFFWIEHFDVTEHKHMRTKYYVHTMNFVFGYYKHYKFIRTEKEYFEWCIKYGN